jgi:hypothetical protein
MLRRLNAPQQGPNTVITNSPPQQSPNTVPNNVNLPLAINASQQVITLAPQRETTATIPFHSSKGNRGGGNFDHWNPDAQ